VKNSRRGVNRGQGGRFADADALKGWIDGPPRVSAASIPSSANVAAWRLAIRRTENRFPLNDAYRQFVASRAGLLEKSKSASIIIAPACRASEVDFAALYGLQAALIHYARLSNQLIAKGIRVKRCRRATLLEAHLENIERGMPDLQDGMSLNPTGRMGTPQESAACVLASP